MPSFEGNVLTQRHQNYLIRNHSPCGIAVLNEYKISDLFLKFHFASLPSVRVESIKCCCIGGTTWLQYASSSNCELNVLALTLCLQTASIQKAINAQECATKEKHARGILCSLLARALQ